MCRNICLTFEKEPPPSRVAIHMRKFPAEILVPGIIGWLCHIVVFCGHFGLLHMVVTITFEPTSLVSTRGLSALHEWQKRNNNSSCDKNTMCFGRASGFHHPLSVTCDIKYINSISILHNDWTTSALPPILHNDWTTSCPKKLYFYENPSPSGQLRFPL